MSAIYEVYIDVLAVNNFIVDLAALLAVNIFRKKSVHAHRILAGALLGTCESCLAFVLFSHPPVYLMIVHFLCNPTVIYFTFREKSKQDFFSDICIGYFAFLIIGGAVQWLYDDGAGLVTYEMAVGAALLLPVMFVLWLGRQLKCRMRYLDAKICQSGKYVCLQALSDSGNLLTDPYTGKPVSMIDRHVYEKAYGTPQAVRLIPYESLGRRHGLLEAVTIEKLSYVYEKKVREIPQAVLGLADHALFEHKPYQMIINPQENETGGRYEQVG